MSEHKTGKASADQAPEAKKPSDELRKEKEEEKKHLDEELEEALEMTFPASDPIAVSRPDPPLEKTQPPRDKIGRSKMSKLSGR